jgi:hypothetical protein
VNLYIQLCILDRSGKLPFLAFLAFLNVRAFDGPDWPVGPLLIRFRL